MPGGQGSSRREGNPGAEGDTSEEKQQRGRRGGSEDRLRPGVAPASHRPRGLSAAAPPPPAFDPPPALQRSTRGLC